MRMHPASAAVTRLKLFFHDVPLGHATGFLYEYGQSVGLVSNWHVYAGKNPLTNEVLHSTGYLPNRVEFHVTVSTRKSEGEFFEFKPMNLPITESGNSLWWQHAGYLDPEDQPHLIDIGVLDLTHQFAALNIEKHRVQSFAAQVLVSPDMKNFQQGTVGVGSEVFILGYPKGLANQGVLPVWKRGSLASEPLFDIEGNLPIIYVDALSRAGMSGSPVIAMRGDILDESGLRAGRSARYDPWLLGVYAGRRGSSPDEIEMALGRVWKRWTLDEIFVQRVPGGSEPQHYRLV